jgi:acetylornithine deacetylase
MATHAQRFERIARLVARPSVSSAAPGWDQSNREVIAELADQLDAAGFAVELLPLPGKPEKQNLIATLGRGEGGLVLAGHTDTVPYDAALWTSDPFKLTERDGKLYGLGTCDMKAFFALALEAAEGVNPDSLRAPLIVLATADEESTMDGARALVGLQRPRGRYAVIGEPTDMVPVRAHKGIMMERIKLVGQSGHSSDPRLGNSALDGMTHVQLALILLRAELADLYRDASFDVPTPTLNLGRIQGGDSANRICGECELDIDVRLLPGMDPAWVRDQIEERCANVLLDTGLMFSVTSVVESTPPHQLARDTLLVRAAEELTGAEAVSAAFATEAPYLAQLGTDTLVLGPGGVGEAHKPDEFVRADRLEPSVRVLRAMLERLCKTAPK